MRKVLVVFTIMVAILFVGCSTYDVGADVKMKQKQEKQQTELNNQIGLPDIVNWSEKKNMKYIYELRDRTDLICYLYTRSEVTGKYIYEGECMGYGIPYSTQYSNPEKIVEGDKELGYNLAGVVNYPMSKPLCEPNGLFMPTSSSATWIIRLSDKGEPKVEYYEPSIVVTPIKKPRNLCEKDSLPPDY